MSTRSAARGIAGPSTLLNAKHGDRPSGLRLRQSVVTQQSKLQAHRGSRRRRPTSPVLVIYRHHHVHKSRYVRVEMLNSTSLCPWKLLKLQVSIALPRSRSAASRHRGSEVSKHPVYAMKRYHGSVTLEVSQSRSWRILRTSNMPLQGMPRYSVSYQATTALHLRSRQNMNALQISRGTHRVQRAEEIEAAATRTVSPNLTVHHHIAPGRPKPLTKNKGSPMQTCASLLRSQRRVLVAGGGQGR